MANEVKLTKGSIHVRERGIIYTFMFNPAELEISKEITLPKETPAGASNPIYNFASGGERLITFTLYLDGDRGRSDGRPKTAPGNNSQNRVRDASAANSSGLTQLADAGTNNLMNTSTGKNTSLSVMDEVNLLQGLLYPTQYGKTAREVYPYLCMFTFGGAFPATQVVVKKADPKLIFFTPGLGPVKGTVAMQLGIVKPAYETAAEFAPSEAEAAAARSDAQAAGTAMTQGIGAGIVQGITGFNPIGGARLMSALRGGRLAMISKDSRNSLTDSVQKVSMVTGLPDGPAYLDLRDRAEGDPFEDQVIEVQDHTTNLANLATLTLHDPRYWWVLCDLANVVDPFEVTVGDKLVVPAQDRLQFQIMSRPTRGGT